MRPILSLPVPLPWCFDPLTFSNPTISPWLQQSSLSLSQVRRYDMERGEIGAQERDSERESVQKKENIQKKEWEYQGKTQSLRSHTTNHASAIQSPPPSPPLCLMRKGGKDECDMTAP